MTPASGPLEIRIEALRLAGRRDIELAGQRAIRIRRVAQAVREGFERRQMLATEQARWVELNGRLDELDRLLGPIR
jgi:hypothetical protein